MEKEDRRYNYLKIIFTDEQFQDKNSFWKTAYNCKQSGFITEEDVGFFLDIDDINVLIRVDKPYDIPSDYKEISEDLIKNEIINSVKDLVSSHLENCYDSIIKIHNFAKENKHEPYIYLKRKRKDAEFSKGSNMFIVYDGFYGDSPFKKLAYIKDEIGHVLGLVEGVKLDSINRRYIQGMPKKPADKAVESALNNYINLYEEASEPDMLRRIDLTISKIKSGEIKRRVW